MQINIFMYVFNKNVYIDLMNINLFVVDKGKKFN